MSFGLGTASSSTAPDEWIRPHDQDAITPAPTMPISGVHPNPTIEATREKSSDGQHRSHRIGKDVQISCAKIVVARVVVVMLMLVIIVIVVRMKVVVVVAEQPGADKIDPEAEHGDQRRLVEANGNGFEDADYRLVTDE